MEIYFGKVNFDEYDNVDPSETLKSNGEHFWYKAVIDEDQVCFYDTCGRHFPISLENIREADTIMFAAKELHHAQVESQEVLDRAHRKIDALLKFWENEWQKFG